MGTVAARGRIDLLMRGSEAKEENDETSRQKPHSDRIQ